MWVRSQDKRRLVKCESFEIYGNRSVIFGYTKNYVNLGEYSTEEKALKVLDALQTSITKTITNTYNNKFGVFQMPQDDEVF